MKKLILTTLSTLLISLSQASLAEISANDLPSLGNLAKLIGEAEPEAVEASVYDDAGFIATGMITDDSMRGETGKEIAGILSDGDAEQQARLESGIAQLREGFEEQLASANFAMNDLGVGLSVSFLSFWELASDKTLPLESSLKVGKLLVHSFKPMVNDARFEELSNEVKAEFYDWTMTTPVALLGLVQAFEAEGATEQAQQLREKAASLFVDLFKIPHTFFTISDDGELGVNVDEIQTFQEDNGLSEDW